MKFQAVVLFSIPVFALSTSNNSNLPNVLTSIINNSKSYASKHNKGLQANTNAPNMIISNDIAPSQTPLGKYSGVFSTSNYSSNGQCREGEMFCDYYGNGFWTCAQGQYVYRNCGPGTKCVQKDGNLYCDYA